jgi:septal ring factor EnvC (AmiA/AmiB activator)
MRVVFTLLLCLLLAVPAHAGRRDDLQRVEKDLKAQQAKEAEYASQQKDIEGKLSGLRKDLVSLAEDVQIRERALLKVQTRAGETQEEIAVAEEILNKQRQSLAEVIMALQRLSRMPPQMLIVRPTTPITTARSFRILQEVIPTVQQQASDVQQTLTHLASLQESLIVQEADLKKEHEEVSKRQAALESTIAERQKLLRQTQDSQKAAANKSQSLAKQAKDMRDLLEKLNQQPPSLANPPRIVRNLKNWFGPKASLPVAGNIKTGYGDILTGGGESQGLTIEAAPKAIVVTPSSGIVRFAGPFRQYKLLVIIQHTNGEHSLLGGLQEIYTRVGDTVVAGEPVGKLSGDSKPLASLYYERRRNGKPIDPRLARG